MINGLENKEYHRKWRIKNPGKNAMAQKKYRSRNPEKYKTEYKTRHKNNKKKEHDYYMTRKEKHLKTGQVWREKNKESYLKATRKYTLRKNYNLSLEQYDILLQVQNNACAVCNGTDNRRLCVDHNHKTGKVRGLLCRSCNLAIGNAKEDLQTIKNLIDYLVKHDYVPEKTGIKG